MNDSASDVESMALTYEEAKQVLRLTPEGLRRLADLDEAINELKAARRSLLANRLESIRDAFAASRNGRTTEGIAEAADDMADPAQKSRATLNDDAASPDTPDRPVADTPSIRVSAPPRLDGDRERPLEQALGRAGQAHPVDGNLRELRGEVAELRREIAGLKRSNSTNTDAQLQQVQRRLSYLEAELESREI